MIDIKSNFNDVISKYYEHGRTIIKIIIDEKKSHSDFSFEEFRFLKEQLRKYHLDPGHVHYVENFGLGQQHIEIGDSRIGECHSCNQIGDIHEDKGQGHDADNKYERYYSRREADTERMKLEQILKYDSEKQLTKEDLKRLKDFFCL